MGNVTCPSSRDYCNRGAAAVASGLKNGMEWSLQTVAMDARGCQELRQSGSREERAVKIKSIKSEHYWVLPSGEMEAQSTAEEYI